ncbi:MAG: mannose-1-phosphate guanylyltransferase/mannose-6-phosphate isomerase [Ancylobacter novellus]|uniref:mannose-1-phosphate guanylyltransferase n=1 Tax=Ancylobacter novellus TaxID=921 RepID=A0A2W5MNL5_ANCNO|nr:MAG: mannose-1-phosphate guanylyltransferase/mannose-6-phosphate isomerase [Ancylobacter novellus]
MNIHPVILCGGSGVRLWPLSRGEAPKQFIELFGEGEGTLFDRTLERLSAAQGFSKPLVVSNEAYRFQVSEALDKAGVTAEAVLLEPLARNTAPAIAAAAAALIEMDPEAIMAVMPSDHMVGRPEEFAAAVLIAAQTAAKGKIVLLGVKPDTPHEGYGYIRVGAALEPGGNARKVASFHEKPQRTVAEGYLASGDYLWNGGFFIMRAATLLDELRKFEPEVAEAAIAAYTNAKTTGVVKALDADALEACPSISIDHAVMERTDAAAVVAIDVGWSDIGSWSALADIGPADEQGNVVTGDALLENTTNTLVHAPDRLVATLGVDNLMVVSTGDAVLVANRAQAQGVSALVQALRAAGRPEAHVHLRQHRPWGFFERLAIGDRFQVKLLHVKPGGKLSLQMHYHRSEHWVVVRGTARVTVDGTERFLRENESVYISATQWHRLENPGKQAVEIIEVQIGSYVGEDDIVRSDDIYARDAREKPKDYVNVPESMLK